MKLPLRWLADFVRPGVGIESGVVVLTLSG